MRQIVNCDAGGKSSRTKIQHEEIAFYTTTFLFFDPVKHSSTDKEEFQSYESDDDYPTQHNKAFQWIKLSKFKFKK